MNESELIRLAMSALGRRKKTMSEAALRQRQIAGQKSVEARRLRGPAKLSSEAGKKVKK